MQSNKSGTLALSLPAGRESARVSDLSLCFDPSRVKTDRYMKPKAAKKVKITACGAAGTTVLGIRYTVVNCCSSAVLSQHMVSSISIRVLIPFSSSAHPNCVLSQPRGNITKSNNAALRLSYNKVGKSKHQDETMIGTPGVAGGTCTLPLVYINHPRLQRKKVFAVVHIKNKSAQCTQCLKKL